MGKRLLVYKVFKIIIVVSLLLIFLLTATVALGAVLRDESQLSPWGMGYFIIATGSMEPAIPVGSVIFVTSVPADKIEEGDVVTYFAHNWQDVVTHRVMSISVEQDAYTFITRGDANNADDPPLEYERVIGRVFLTISGNNLILGMLGGSNTGQVGMIMVAAGLALCVFGVVSSLRKKKPTDEEAQSEENTTSNNSENNVQTDDNIPISDNERAYDFVRLDDNMHRGYNRRYEDRNHFKE